MSWCFKMSLQLPKGHLSFVERWPLMNQNDMAFIIITYLVFILKLGPMLMEKRSPYKLQSLLVFYNVVKVVNSIFLAYKFILYIMDKGLFPRKCEHDDRTLYMIAILYWKYMVTKILDLFDTIFFVVRKKTSQITFLHVYHHVFMVIMTWCCLKYDPSDHWAFMAIVNCTIHVVMYIYYGISALGPSFAKYLWWKKYLTMMQLVFRYKIAPTDALVNVCVEVPQFLAIVKQARFDTLEIQLIFHFLEALEARRSDLKPVMQFLLVIGHVVIQTYTSECPMRPVSYWISLANLALFICLFTDFYSKRYISKNKEITFACSKQATD